MSITEHSVEEVREMAPADRAKYDQEVYSRIIRLQELRPDWELSPNCRLPGHERANYVLIGSGDYLNWAGGGPDGHPAPVVKSVNYSAVVLLCPPGKGAPLHAHTTEETFFVLNGTWVFYWGDGAEHQATLNPLDAVSFPPPVMRGFRNCSLTDAQVLSIIGGGSPAPPINHPSVLQALQERGLSESWKAAADGR